jgi:hypothetical protein
MIRCVTSFLLFIVSNVGFLSFIVFVYIKHVFPKQLMVLKCIMYFQAIAGGANEELSRQGKD